MTIVTIRLCRYMLLIHLLCTTRQHADIPQRACYNRYMQTVSRLIDSYVPDHYALSLTLDRSARTFDGIVTIHGAMPAGSQHIVVHAKSLMIESVVVDGKSVEFASSDNDELFITHPDLTPGSHIVVIAYSGIITDAMHGLYPCYFESDGVKKELLATQFESHHAREVFPCIDEPAAKATFDVTLTTEPGITVLGNMPVITQVTKNDLLVTTFDTTPRMSTYLLAWVIGELRSVHGVTKRGVDVNIWATTAQPASSLDFALDISIKTIEFYEQYFDTEYPLPKSDHVALPDFSSGAMENWGLITYREIALLADPVTTSISSRQYIATVIAHELAHQWFGNLVTMQWWNNLWLNESFATLMEYIAIDAIHPEWDIWLDFSASESIMALRRDSIDGVQSVQIDVNHPDEINTLFDGAIVYAKGARLLRMLQHYVGDDAFQAGLKQYFTDFAFNNTVGDDLWKAIAASSGKDIVGLMNTWISQPGYPVLHVSQTGDQVTLKQQQFFVGPHTDVDRIWPLPLGSTCSEMPVLLDVPEQTATRHHTTTLRFNVGDTAHFITHYDDTTFNAIINDVRSGSLQTVDRMQVLNEATLLARGGITSSATLIPLIQAFEHETAEHVWTMVSITLAELRKFVEDDEAAEKQLRALSASIAHDEYIRLGWTASKNESESDTKLRSTIISMTLYGEDSDAIAYAKQLFDTTPLEDLDAELRPLIISTAVRYGDAMIVDTLLERYISSQSGELCQDITVGITSTRIDTSIAQLLAAIKDSKVVRPQDAARWFVYLVRGRESRGQSWQWIRDNWQWVIDTFGGDKSYDDYPRYSASALSTRDQLQEYIDFFTPQKDIPALTRVITMGISEIEGRVELIERDGPAVRKALHDL
jgi:aminopeptidase N